MKNLIEVTLFLTSMLAQAETGVADRYVRAVIERDGAVVEEQGDWLLDLEVEAKALTLVIKPDVFQAQPRCVLGRQRPEALIVDYFLRTTAAMDGISTPGKIVIRRRALDDLLWFPITVTCY
ncbi:hypothetical protein [Pseudomonas sp. NA-150]|uniref:hypothetical protein n=1 Tax=Pseudomonas sp. NA-150 TaxID=3367525 RepID=UPI0037CA2AEE